MTPDVSTTHENRRLALPDPQVPWWIAAIYKIGVPSAIAIYLVLRLTQGLPSAADVIDVKALLTTHVMSTEAQLVEIRLLLRAICYNTAKNDAAARACAGERR